MDINKKFRWSGYADLVISSAQGMVATMTTVGNIYDHLHKDNDENGFITTYIWPIVNVVMAVIFIGISVTQIQSARKLRRAGYEDVSTEEKKRVREKWMERNVVTSFAAVTWFCCLGVTTFWSNGWNIPLIVGLFLGTVLSRGVVTWGVNGIVLDEDIEMQGPQERQHRPQTPMLEPRWIIRHTGYGTRGDM